MLVDIVAPSSFIVAMVNNFEFLAERLLPKEAARWLNVELTRVSDLANKWDFCPYSHDVICDLFWPVFNDDLSKKSRDEGWDNVEWLVAREAVRTAIHRSFAKVGQWVDEFPIQGWQFALIEELAIRQQLGPAREGPSTKRL